MQSAHSHEVVPAPRQSAQPSAQSAEAVTMQSLSLQLTGLMVHIAKITVALNDLKLDVNALKNLSFSSSNTDVRILCPLGCGSDFKKVSDSSILATASPHHSCRCPTCWIT